MNNNSNLQALGFHGNERFRYCVITMILNNGTEKKFPRDTSSYIQTEGSKHTNIVFFH